MTALDLDAIRWAAERAGQALPREHWTPFDRDAWRLFPMSTFQDHAAGLVLALVAEVQRLVAERAAAVDEAEEAQHDRDDEALAAADLASRLRAAQEAIEERDRLRGVVAEAREILARWARMPASQTKAARASTAAKRALEVLGTEEPAPAPGEEAEALPTPDPRASLEDARRSLGGLRIGGTIVKVTRDRRAR